MSVSRRWTTRYLPVLGMIAIFAAPVETLADWHYQAAVGGAWRTVEESEDGNKLVEEAGPSVGATVALERSIGDWFVGFDAGIERAELDYDGSTQAGAPLATDTDWSEGHFGAIVGRRFDGVFAGLRGRLQYQWRERDIASTPSAWGLSESYRTVWLDLGLTIRPARLVTLEFELGCAINSRVDISFASALDDAALDVDDHCRIGVEAPIKIGRIYNSTVFVRPFVAWERYPKSSAERLYSSGLPIGQVFLPATEFVSFGVSIGIGQSPD